MEGLMHFLQQSDAVGGSVALLLLLMSYPFSPPRSSQVIAKT